MMQAKPAIFLTGGTGLLGRYLLRDLLAAGYRVTMLVRDSLEAKAADRVAELMAFCSDSLRKQLPLPVVMAGDLTAPGLGLMAADRRWLAGQGLALVHAAAQVDHRP